MAAGAAFISAGSDHFIFVKTEGKGLQDFLEFTVGKIVPKPAVQNVSGKIYSQYPDVHPDSDPDAACAGADVALYPQRGQKQGKCDPCAGYQCKYAA